MTDLSYDSSYLGHLANVNANSFIPILIRVVGREFVLVMN